MRQLERALVLGAAFAGGGLAVLALAYALATVSSRPYESVEGELAFEASRLRAHLPLYVDPRIGAFDYGPVPARYFAHYTPVGSAALSLVPATAAKVVARVASLSAWLATLALGVLGARPSHEPRTATSGGARASLLFALFAAGCFFLVRGFVSGTADTLATLLATAALLRIVRHDALSPGDALLLGLAPLVKPNVLGVFLGVCVVEGVRIKRRERPLGASSRALAVAVTTVAMGVLVFEASSHGAWLEHLYWSAAPELRLGRWVEQFGARMVLLGVPHLAIGVIAYKRGTWSPYAVGALVASVAWAGFSMAKSGSATNYWLEPTAAALVTVATTRGAAFERDGARVCAAVGGLSAFLSAFPLIRMWSDASAAARALPEVSRVCALAPGEMLGSPDAGIEVELTGRLWIPSFVMTHALRHGRFSTSSWRRDIALPALKCVVTRGEYFEVDPPNDPEERRDRLADVVELKDAYDASFVRAADADPFRVYLRR
jgi:hypothetical protein